MTLAPSLFPVPKGWQLLNVEKIRSPEKSSCVSGPFGSKIASKYFVEEGVPVIRGNNLRDDLTRFIPSGFVFVSESQAQEYRPQHVKGGDLVFTCWGTIGQVGLIPDNGPHEQYIISNKQLKLRVDRSIANPVFCFYQIASPAGVGYIRNRGIGGAVPGINLGILKALPVALPDLRTQNRIVSVLTAYDDLIENNRRRMVLLEESARLLYREWFVRLRFPGHESTRMVNGVPESWERESLSQLTDFLKRGIAPHYDEAAESLVINQKCIRDGRVNLNLARRQSREFKDERQVLKGDVLVNSTGEGTLGRVAQQKEDVPNCTVDTHVTIVRPNERVSMQYFGLALMEWEPRFSTMGKGSTNQTELSPAAIAECKILVPPKYLQWEFDDVVDATYSQITNLTAQNQKLRAARDLLLPKLMSGEIEV